MRAHTVVIAADPYRSRLIDGAPVVENHMVDYNTVTSGGGGACDQCNRRRR